MSKPLVIALIGVAAAALVLALRAAGGPSDVRSGRQGEATTPAAPAPEQDDPGPRHGPGLLPGELLRYDVDLETTVRAGGKESVQAHRGPLVVRVYRRDLVGLSFARLGGEVFVAVDEHGNTGEPDFPDTMPVQKRLVWRDVLAAWRVVLPADTSAERWEAVEADRTGRFAAYYRRLSPGVVERRKEEYLDEEIFVRGTARAVLGPYLTDSLGSERRWDDEVEEVVRFTCTLAHRERVDLDELRARLKPRTRLAFEDLARTPDEAEIQRRVLDALHDGDMERLGRLLSRFPAAADVVSEQLRDPSCARAGRLVRALGRANAEKALIAALAHHPEVATAVLGRLLNPSDAVVDALVRISGPDALYALAKIGRRAKGKDDARHTRIRDLVVAALDESAVPTLRAVRALRPRKVPDAVCALAEHEDAAVRAAAATTAGACDDGAALLQTMLHEDPAEDVRSAALLALRERLPPDAYKEALEGVLAEDASEALREQAARLLERCR